MNTQTQPADIIIVGGGNAALCAAIAAAQNGASVTVLEAAAQPEAGGNSWFTDGAMRFAIEDERAIPLLLQLPAKQAARLHVPPYPAAQYAQDLLQAGGAHANPALLHHLASRSYDTMQWLRDNGVPLELISDNQAHEINGRLCFFGNLVVRSVQRGIGLIQAQTRRAQALGARILYNARATQLRADAAGQITGLSFMQDGKPQQLAARAVILACGGFEANADMRAEHLGEHWRQVRVRGSRHNTGCGLRMALAAGAARAGDWTGCHAVGTDANTPDGGDVSKPGDIWKKHSYPYGIMINQRGERFVDEGADLRNYTYAKYGKEILRQPNATAYQIFDAQTEPLLRSEYRHEFADYRRADTLQQLAEQLPIDRERFLQEAAAYNAAVAAGEADGAGQFNPAALDGKRTKGLPLPKSNWALSISKPPFLAFPIVCGITFTFGGVAVDTRARVLRADGAPIAGLFAAGEMVGGLFGHNYPGGSGLMSGAVFGRTAGETAADAG